MPKIDFILADQSVHRAELTELNLEYVGWVLSEVECIFGVPPLEAVGLPLAEYVAGALAKICSERPPRGVFYLLRVDGALAGMGGLRFLEEGVAEIKRLYIRSQHRGLGLGALALQRILGDARAFGYSRVRLDTGPFMPAAQRLYERNGFADRGPYAGVEVPAVFHGNWRFMERSLADATKLPESA